MQRLRLRVPLLGLSESPALVSRPLGLGPLRPRLVLGSDRLPVLFSPFPLRLQRSLSCRVPVRPAPPPRRPRRHRLTSTTGHPRAEELASGRAWPCTVCGEVLRGDTPFKLYGKKRTHCFGKHPEVPWKTFLLRPFIEVLQASKDLPEADRDWVCPVKNCGAALPKQATKRARTKAFSAHRIAAHPRIPMSKWRGMMMKKAHTGRSKPSSVKTCLERAFKARKKAFPTHRIVAVPCTSANEYWCMGCLGLAGYGGSSRVRVEKLAFPKTRVRLAWERLKGRKDIDGQPLFPQLSQWVRNLLEDGDVERQPGPSNGSRKLTVMCCNTSSSSGVWAVLRQAQGLSLDVALLQETSLKPAEREPFRAAARRQGFRWYEPEGYQGRFRGHRGVGVLVRHDLRSHECGRWREHDAQALAVLVEGVVLVSLYHAGESDAHSVFSDLLRFLSGAASGGPWLVAGDFNSQPQESPFCDWLLQDGAHLKAVKDAQGILLPTRYQGDRCIDYGISSHAESARIADHYSVKFLVTPRTASKGAEDHSCLLPAPSLAKPQSCDRETWQSLVEEEWAEVNLEPVPEEASQQVIDAAWAEFSHALETCLVRVLNKLQEGSNQVSLSVKPFRTGFKNTVRLIRTPVRRGSKKAPQSSFYERRLCKLLHRLSELHRLESSNREWCPAYQTLCEQVSKWNLSGTWLQQIDFVKKLLADHRAAKEKDRIEAWKQRLVNSDGECYKWVASAGIIPPANVSSPAAPQLGISRSTTGSRSACCALAGRLESTTAVAQPPS